MLFSESLSRCPLGHRRQRDAGIFPVRDCARNLVRTSSVPRFQGLVRWMSIPTLPHLDGPRARSLLASRTLGSSDQFRQLLPHAATCGRLEPCLPTSVGKQGLSPPRTHRERAVQGSFNRNFPSTSNESKTRPNSLSGRNQPVHQRIRFLVERGIFTRIPSSARALRPRPRRARRNHLCQ